MIISGEIGYSKPAKEFFDYVKGHIPDFDEKTTLVIGDSLTSDIRGGNNAGIDTLWFNPHKQENAAGVQINYEAAALHEIGDMLRRTSE